jgi:predicted carbohydrate-binding protein with CBM5 and CBM33 domain
MSSLVTTSRQVLRRRLLAVATLAVCVLAAVLVDAAPAAAHGSAIDPPSRQYRCATVWTDWLNQIMATRDPMCWQAYQADPQAMWTWNGLIQNNVNDDHQARVPDGHLCSGGDSNYEALNTPGYWVAQDVNNTFNWTMHDQARHGAKYIHIYVTKQGFDPTTQRLKWSDLELVKDTGSFPDTGWPTRPNDPLLNGVDYGPFQISAPGRTGRHIVYAVWRAGHADQNYYMCSDVRFPGGPPDPTTPPPPPLPGNNGCSTTYTPGSQWPGGFQAEVKVTAGAAAISGWTLTVRFPDGQTMGQIWNADFTANADGTYTVRNGQYTGNLAAGASASFGFIGNWLETNRPPEISCAAPT